MGYDVSCDGIVGQKYIEDFRFTGPLSKIHFLVLDICSELGRTSGTRVYTEKDKQSVAKQYQET